MLSCDEFRTSLGIIACISLLLVFEFENLVLLFIIDCEFILIEFREALSVDSLEEKSFVSSSSATARIFMLVTRISFFESLLLLFN